VLIGQEIKILYGNRSKLRETLFSNRLVVDGSRTGLLRFLTLFEKPKATFNIVTP